MAAEKPFQLATKRKFFETNPLCLLRLCDSVIDVPSQNLHGYLTEPWVKRANMQALENEIVRSRKKRNQSPSNAHYFKPLLYPFVSSPLSLSSRPPESLVLCHCRRTP